MYLKGDLNQMANQKSILQEAGFCLRQEDVYQIIVAEEDIKRALVYIYINKVDGWWNYERLFIEYNVCTKEQFWIKLKGL